MRQRIIPIVLAAGSVCLAYGQSTEPQPKFEAVDVHVSAKSSNPFMRTGPVRGGRYEVKAATMVDLIRIAYGYDLDKILGGPNWLEMDRFDVIAKAPSESTADTQKLMLQSVLEDRFKLVFHKDTRAMPTYALSVGKKPQMKEASGEEQTGCHPQTASGAPGEGGTRLTMATGNGPPMTLNLGPGMTVQYQCRNITMEAFAGSLRGLVGASLGQNAVMDETGLKGAWNFDLKYSMQLMGPLMAEAGDRISIFAAIEKLGLKLEEKQVPTLVIVVDSVNQKPSPNPPGVVEVLPPIPVPTEFEVASIKPSDPNTRMGRFQMQPGGRLVSEGMALHFLVSRAFNTFNNEAIVGLPAFADTDRYDINAKLPSGGPAINSMDMDLMAPLILGLLKDRFKLTYHTEEQPLSAYTLVSAKPKMKKADPASRVFCKTPGPTPGAPPGSRVLKCQNITMAQFAERLQGFAPEFNWPVLDGTGIEGGWDFTLTFSMRMPMMGPGMGRSGEGNSAPGALPAAPDPSDNYTIFEAIEKQLGLKVEKQKRPMPVIVIDHIEQKPTDN
jgi:uncharacterized protein (TIGR03435 family)